jgi:hypothetical protein
MKKIAKRFPRSIVPKSLLGLAIFLSLSWSVRAQVQAAQVIEVTAKKYEYSSSPFHVKIGTKVQLKITATDHDHGFKISAVPDGALPNGAAGLIFSSAQECWQLKKGKRPRLSSWLKHRALTRLSAATPAVSGTKA